MDEMNVWKAHSSLSDAFYLFVRIEARAKVLRILNFHRTSFKGLGLYAYDSYDHLLVKTTELEPLFFDSGGGVIDVGRMVFASIQTVLAL